MKSHRTQGSAAGVQGGPLDKNSEISQPAGGARRPGDAKGHLGMPRGPWGPRASVQQAVVWVGPEVSREVWAVVTV